MTTALIISLLFGSPIIKWLYKKGIRDNVRVYGNVGSEKKQGTPSMGGIIIILALVVSILLWNNLNSLFSLLPLAAIIWYGMIGAKDDLQKFKHKDSDSGMSQKIKIILQGLFAAGLAYVLISSNTTPFPEGVVSKVSIPYVNGTISFDMGNYYVILVVITMLSISNAVNFADGLDGLTIVPSIVTGGVYGVLGYLIGNAVFSNYLLYDFIPGLGEITVIMAALFGAGMGFLWYNSYPAAVFMGDTGSMAIGGLLGVTVILVKQELLFIVAGGIFVMEAFSVLIQQKVGINILKRRIFYRAPIHHSFQFKGIPEPKIVQRFWIISIILALVALSTLKLR